MEKDLKNLTNLVLTKNEQLNLTAHRTFQRCFWENVVDSLAYNLVDLQWNGLHVLDIGTGGGFPLLPMGLMMSDTHFTGLDAREKKINAVLELANNMQLTNISGIAGRTEDLAHAELYREQYDIVTARAVASMPILLEWSAAFIKLDGYLLAWKGSQAEDEIAEAVHAAKVLGLELVASVPYSLTQLKENYNIQEPLILEDYERYLVVYKKCSQTKKMYPRNGGLIKRKPF
jgi:16S rRNA (guanine527-N7)-methyltransferase